MTEKALEPRAAIARADKLIEGAAQEVQELLRQVAAQLFPFPYFLGSTEVRAVEAEPGGAKKAERGCIVVCGDGELYEFTMKMQAPGPDMEVTLERTDEVKPANLPPEDYIAYAYHAVRELAKVIEEQQGRGQKYTW